MRKRLFFDIEVSPNIGFFWQPGYNINVDYNNIIKERAVICVCYKWEHKDKVYALTWDENQNDKYLLSTLVSVMNEADEIISHNGDRFDQAWVRTRCVFHGIPMPPNYVSIDTLKVARGKFKFNSNRLDYIGQFLGVGAKTQTGGFDLWKEITLKNNKRALKDMVDYCKNDVLLLESIFNKLNPYIPPKSSVSSDSSNCPECNSPNVIKQGYRKLASGQVKAKMQCGDCGKWHQTNVKNEKNS